MVGVKTGGGFIEDEQLGVAEEGLCKAYKLAVTFAEFTNMFVALGSQSNSLDERIDRFAVC